jgi:hypothetical protein
MPSSAEPKKRFPARRRPVAPVVERPAPDFYFVQVHFQPRPGARKTHFDNLLPQLSDLLQSMIRDGQLLLAGGYPSSIGGLWLLKVRTLAEAERLVQAHPAVVAQMLTYRLLDLQEPAGIVVPAAPPAAPAA